MFVHFHCNVLLVSRRLLNVMWVHIGGVFHYEGLVSLTVAPRHLNGADCVSVCREANGTSVNLGQQRLPDSDSVIFEVVHASSAEVIVK
jgi:hypothetical protein